MRNIARAAKVSILVTVYNRENFLADCLESILVSSFQGYEVIVVDDQSSDDSLRVANEFAMRDSRVRVYRNEKNLGDYPNRMKAAELACGKYIKYVDADDIIYPHSLAIMVEAMEANPDAVLGLAHSPPEEEKPYPWKLEPREAWRKHFLGRGCLSCGPTGAILRRDFFMDSAGFGNWGVINDMDLWIRMSAVGPILLLPPGLVWWRRHEGQEFTKGNAAWVYLVDGFRMIMGHLTAPYSPLESEETKAAIDKVRQHHARRILSLALRARRPLRALNVFHESDLKFTELLKGLICYR